MIFLVRIFDLCKKKNLKTTLVSKELGKVALRVSGKNAISVFKHEAGKHVVQRCPPTENKGRRQTSVVSVSVLPLQEERNFVLLEKDLETKTQRGHGKGGQHQNTTDSAVRMTHKPTGVSVFINGRDQHANKREARRIIESRVADIFRLQKHAKFADAKRIQVDGGGRGNKIRTYNFIESRATDHRTGKKTSKLNRIMKGEFDLLK